MRDAFQTEKYANLMKERGWQYEWRRGNLFMIKRRLGFTFETCHYPATEVFLSDFKGEYCQVRGSAWKLPDPFVCGSDQSVRIALDRNIEEIWLKLRKHTRNAIRQARNRGCLFAEGNIANFEAFWKIHENTAARRGFNVVKPKVLLDYLNAGFSRIFLVSIGENIVGAYLVLEGEGVARYFCGGSSYKFQHFRPNNLAHWSILEYYQKKGFAIYDMGSIGKEQQYGIPPFKTGFGKSVVIWNCQRGNWLMKKATSWYRSILGSKKPRSHE